MAQVIVKSIIVVAVVAWLFCGGPQIWQRPAGPLYLKVAEAASKDLTIELTIKTDQELTQGLAGVTVPFVVNDIDKKAESLKIKPRSFRDSIKLNQQKKQLKDTPYQVYIPKDAPICEERRKQIEKKLRNLLK